MTEYLNQLLAWVSLHPHWAGIAIFLVAMGESLAIVGLLVPGVILMFGIGALISIEALAFWPTCAWAVAGAVAGDGLSFFLGRHFRDRIRAFWPFSKHPQSLERGEVFFQRYGGKSVAIGRFFGPVRAVIPLVAGMMGMPVSRFVAANVASAVAWAPAYLLPGMVLGASLELASEVAFRLVLLLLILLALLWFVIWLIKRVFRLVHPHATAWLQALLNWGELHPKLGEIAAALANPTHPESKGLAVLATLLIATTALSGLILGAVGGGNPFSGVDQAVFEALQSLRTPWADHLMVHFSRLGDYQVLIPLILGMVAFLAWQRHWRTIGYWLAAAAFAFATAPLLKQGFRIPRPDLDITGLGSYAFPSGHVLRATVIYGFLSVMIARALSPRFRWLPYTVAGTLITAVAIARPYLGAHWLSDVLASLSLGLVWVALLGIAYHRHTAMETRWRSLTLSGLLLLGLAFGIHGARSHALELARYTPARTESVLSLQAWWSGEGWTSLPLQRDDVRGRHDHPLQIQYAGSLGTLTTALEGQGWQLATMLDWDNALRLLSPSLNLAELPLLPQVHDGRHEARVLSKQLSEHQRLVLRLWPADRMLTPGELKLWIGSISSQHQAYLLKLLTFAETDPDFHAPFERLQQDVQGLKHRRPALHEDILLLQQTKTEKTASQ